MGRRYQINISRALFLKFQKNLSQTFLTDLFPPVYAQYHNSDSIRTLKDSRKRTLPLSLYFLKYMAPPTYGEQPVQRRILLPVAPQTPFPHLLCLLYSFLDITCILIKHPYFPFLHFLSANDFILLKNPPYLKRGSCFFKQFPFF